jgi:hypothetical protein
MLKSMLAPQETHRLIRIWVNAEVDRNLGRKKDSPNKWSARSKYDCRVMYTEGVEFYMCRYYAILFQPEHRAIHRTNQRLSAMPVITKILNNSKQCSMGWKDDRQATKSHMEF